MSRPPTAQKPTAVAGRYVVFGKIASGGMATVHYGRLLGQAGFTRTVAIKRIHAHCAEDPEFLSMFLDEARLVGRIRHPNVVPVLDVVADENGVAIVMEYVQGETLGRLMRAALRADTRPPVRVVASIMTGVLAGLHAAHIAVSDQGEPLNIVHRDVSPQNVMVGVDGVARVLDFGIAKATVRLQSTRDGQLKGKLQYMAPEQLRNQSASRQTDIYSAAVVLWEMLAGRLLFAAENQAAVMSMVLGNEIPPLREFCPSISDALARVVERGVRAVPEERFDTAESMAIALEEAAGIASPREVSRWVESVASDVIRLRSTEVAEVESVSSDFDIDILRKAKHLGTAAYESGFGGVLGTDDVIRGTEPGVAGAPPVAATFGQHDGVAARGLAPEPAVDDAIQTMSASRRRRALVLITAGFIAGVALLGVAIWAVLVGPSGDSGQLAAGLASASAPTWAGASISAPAPETAALPGGTALAVDSPAPGSARTGPSQGTAPDAGRAPPPGPARTAGIPTPSRAAPTAPAKPGNDCNPPYVIDKEGLRVPKPHCL